MSNAKITYRFDHNQAEIIPLRQDEFQVSEQNEPAAEMETTPNKDHETARLEEIIRQAQPSADSLHSAPQVDHDADIQGYIKQSKVPWLKIITSVFGAIVTGVIFGTFILSFFTAEQEPATSRSETVSDHRLPGDSNIPPIGQLLEDTVTVNIPLQTYTILQHGIFSSTEGLQAAKDNLIAKGLAFASELSAEHYVYAGLTTNRDDALMMSHLLQSQGIETYVKAYALPAVQQLYYAADQADELERYFTLGYDLVNKLSNVSIVQLKQDRAQSIGKEVITEINTSHQAWSQLSTQVQSGIPEQYIAAFEKANKSMTTAIISISEYNQNPDFSFIWQVQASIMEFILLQKQLLNQLAVPA